MNMKVFLVNLQLWIMKFIKSKVFLGVIGVLLFALFINIFTSNSENDVPYDFSKNDLEELEEAEKEVLEEYKVNMGEVNRNSKLITYFFNELISEKSYDIKGITEDYKDVDDFDMQILDIKKTDTGYDVLVEICIRDESVTERVYKPFRRYLINVLSTTGGLKVDYISIVE